MSAPKKKASTKKKTKASEKPKTPVQESLLQRVLDRLSGPDSPVGDPTPRSPEQLRAIETSIGVALPPSLRAVLSYDQSWLEKQFDWFDEDGSLAARTLPELLEAYTDPWIEKEFRKTFAQIFPGKALLIEPGSGEHIEFLYLGAPDEEGEYPIIEFYFRDAFTLTVRAPSCIELLARDLGVIEEEDEEEELPTPSAANKRVFGNKNGLELFGSKSNFPAVAKGPAPGEGPALTVRIPPPGAPRAPETLTDEALGKSLEEAAERGNTARLEELLQECSRRKHKKARAQKNEALLRAATSNKLDAVKILLAAKADPNAASAYGGVLSRAIKSEASLELLTALLDAGASANSPSINGMTVLFDAVEEQDNDLVALLIARGADLKHTDSNGMSVLHKLLEDNDDVELLEALLTAGVDPHLVRKKNRPPFFWAVEQGREKCVDLFLRRGIDPNIVHEDETPLHMAFYRGFDAIAGKLVRAGAKRETKDKRGISFERIFSANGSDARPIEVSYVPSEQAQRLKATVTVTATNQYQLKDLYSPFFTAEYWAALVNNGLAGSNQFAPEIGKAEVLVKECKPLSSVKKVGFHELEFAWKVAGISEDFLSVLARALLGVIPALTGAGYEMVVRGVAVKLQGELSGAGAIDPNKFLERCRGRDLHLEGHEGSLPFQLIQRVGPASIELVPEKKTKRSVLERAAQEPIAAWTTISDLWFPMNLAVQLTPPVLAPDDGSPGVIFLLESIHPALGRVDSFPYNRKIAVGTLCNVLRKLHTRTPIEAVYVTLPSEEMQ